MSYYDKDSLYRVFLEVSKLHHNRIHKLLEETNLYPGQPPLLFVLNKEDGLSQRELAEKLKVRASTMAVMLKRMEKINLLERKQDTEDGRISRVYITELGKEKCEESKEMLNENEEQMFSNLTADEKIILRRLLTVVKNNLKEDKD